jgi:hypothetical protein
MIRINISETSAYLDFQNVYQQQALGARFGRPWAGGLSAENINKPSRLGHCCGYPPHTLGLNHVDMGPFNVVQ